jgi:hypothetical protein
MVMAMPGSVVVVMPVSVIATVIVMLPVVVVVTGVVVVLVECLPVGHGSSYRADDRRPTRWGIPRHVGVSRGVA